MSSAAADTVRFHDLPLRSELLHALAGLGYEEPTPIQYQAIPPLIEGCDLLGQAATGTGKTAAFALPILQRLTANRSDPTPMALVLVPTRELAIQVSEAIGRYGRDLGARVMPIYGGQPIGRQLRVLEQGVDVVVATPGRAMDHIRRDTLNLKNLLMVVLDEADEILDMGFAEDIEAILDETPSSRQTLLFSATMPERINGIAQRHLRDPVTVQIGHEVPTTGQTPLIRQNAYIVPRSSKPAALGRVLDVEAPTAAIVFCRTREEVDHLTEILNGRGYRAEALHGGMGQEQRDRVMSRLRSGTADLVVATDVAARGLDIEQLTHVVNYNVPSAPETYVHRIGRVGRAGREGVAITVAEPREQRLLKAIERVTKRRIAIEKVPTVADLRTRRLEQTRVTLHTALTSDNLDPFRTVVDALSNDFDPTTIALAAIKMAYEATRMTFDEEEIPDVAARTSRTSTGRRDGGRRGERGDIPRREDHRGHTSGSRPQGGKHGSVGTRAPSGGMTRLFIGAGRGCGIRPQDLVGAITGESRLSGREIGAIDIADRFSLVEVPHAAANEVIAALRGATIKGQRPTVRKERGQNR